ncbi:catalase family protein [Deinococcus gobiensis]|uniref:Catalase n=1 Tax=Deinococcus gobiensis (strain DSM 21396 / JCM 16679 / CGMCC 1.7299 / I-0) TaxID=745776 RepID=H8H1B4_DEIGI|nr:catalase family protein [Deinococcus gobiensis]AFD27311.1 Catalase [Deinococcus gobiensis I-0]
MSSEYVRYRDDLEQIQPGEAETMARLTDMMRGFSEAMNTRYRHAVRSVHSKGHGLLVGELEVYEGLPERLAQGLFARPGRYPVVMRFSTPPGDILPDTVSTPRGLALKIVGPEGAEMVDGHAGEVTQDFVFLNSPEFGQKDAAGFMKGQKPIQLTVNAPEEIKVAASLGARVADSLTGGKGKLSPMLRQLGGHPYTHPLGETFYTQLPHRWGDYVGKLSLAPVSAHLRRLKGQPIKVLGEIDALRDNIAAVIAQEGGEWELRVQLSVDEKKMPIEDASVLWDESLSPFLPVARIRIAAQDSARPNKLVYGDDRASFNPWHAQAAHRPLGNVMRARRAAYRMSADFRREHNDEPIPEPRSQSDLPEI